MRERRLENVQQPTASAALDDGTLIEMIHSPELRRTTLVWWDGDSITEYDEVDHPAVGRIVAFSPTNNLLSHGVVLFPSGVRDFGDVSRLRSEIRSFIHRYADVSEGFEEIASCYVMLTWVFDVFPEVPYLRIKGDFGSGKSRCLQTIGSLCYKPMFVSGASSVSSVFRIIDSFRGTLILDESDFRFSDERAEIIKILNNGNAAGFPVLRSEATPTHEFNPRAFTVFGPKIIASRRYFDDSALESRCITEVMTGLPPRAGIPLSLPKSFSDEARSLRNQLLLYRFKHRSSIVPLDGNDRPVAEARVAQIVRPLLALAESDVSRSLILQWALAQSGSLREERGASVEADLLAVLCQMREENVSLWLRDIATRFEEQFGGDFERPVTPRWIGNQLRKRLSLVPIKSHGSFLIPSVQYPRIDALVARYAVSQDRSELEQAS